MLKHLQTNSKADWQKQYYDRATSTIQLMPGDIVLMKLDTCIPEQEKSEGSVERGGVCGCSSGRI